MAASARASVPDGKIKRITRQTEPISGQAALEYSQLITKTFQRIQGRNHFEILEVNRNASAELVRESYFKLAKIFHPDRCSAMGLVELIAQAEEIFRRINEAHTVLTNAEARKAYEEEIDGERSKGEEVRAALEAEFVFQKGVIFYRKKNYTEALQHFQESYRLNEKEGEHLAWVAWTMFSDPKGNREETAVKAKELLLKSIKLSPLNHTCHYYLGEIYLALGDKNRARSCFQRTVELHEGHVEANRHLRLMQMRKEKKAEKEKSLFGRFRKK
jgi:tetratricopeptide (TPR) repeat protein